MTTDTPMHTTGAKREKLAAPRFDLFPARIITEAYSSVAAHGMKTYGARNWEKGLPVSQIASSLQRHLWAYMDGIEKDDDSGLPHLEHMLWNACALVYNAHHKLCDDRIPTRFALESQKES